MEKTTYYKNIKTNLLNITNSRYKKDLLLFIVYTLLALTFVYGILLNRDLLILVSIFTVVVLFSIVAAQKIQIAISLIIISWFFPRPIFYLPFSPLTYIRLDDIAWLILFFAWLMRRPQTLKYLIKLPLAKPLIIFSLMVLISVMRVVYLENKINPVLNSILYASRLFEYFSIYFIISSIELSEKQKKYFINLFLASGIIISLISLMQHFEILPSLEPVMHNKNVRGNISLFTSGPHLSATLLIILVLIIQKLINSKVWKWLLLIPSITIVTLALLLTLTRSVYIGAIASIVMLIIITKKIKYRFLMVAITLFVGWVLLLWKDYLLPNPSIIFEETSLESRLFGWQAFKQIISEDLTILFLGVGFFNWRYALSDQTLIYGGHNNYLSVLGELGIFGFTVFLWIWVKALYHSWSNRNVNDSFGRAYFAILIGLLISCATQETLYPVYVMEGFLGMVMFLSALLPNKILVHKQKRRWNVKF